MLAFCWFALVACVNKSDNRVIKSGEYATNNLVHKEKESTLALEPVAQLIPNFNQSTRISSFGHTDGPFRVNQIGNNASGITWDPYNNEFLIIQNNSAIIYRFDRNFRFVGKLKRAGKINRDTEGISFIDGNHLAIATEANTVHLVEYDQNVIERQYFTSELTLRLSDRAPVKNKGLESVAYRPASEQRGPRIYAAQEGTGRDSNSIMRVFYVDANVSSGIMSDYLSYDNGLEVIEPFDAEVAFAGIITDIAGMTFDPSGETLIIVSQESRKAIQVNPQTGELLSELKLFGARVYEGVTIGPQGNLYFVSEKNLVQIYSRKQ